EDFFARMLDVVVMLHLAQWQLALQIGFDFVEQAQFVARGKLDVDALDGVGVFAHAIERNHHVFVDLEGVGVARDGGGAGAVEPELAACFGRDRHEAFAMTAVGDAHDLAGGDGHRVFVVAHDVADQHHLGQHAALALGGVADGAQIAFVEVLEPGQQGAAFAARAVEILLDLDDGRHGIARLTEELHADGARVGRHAVHDPAHGGDQTVAAFLLYAGQAGQEFVGHVFAQTDLAEAAAFDDQGFGAQREFAGRALAVGPLQFEAGFVDLVDLAQVVADTGHFQPVAFRVAHAPPGEVVERGAPQHGLLAAGVHGHVAARTGGIGRGGVDGEDIAGGFGRFGDAPRDHTG